MTTRDMALLLLSSSALALFGEGRVVADGCARTYVVAPVGVSVPRVDGILGTGEWPAARWESDLAFPWRGEPAPATEFIVRADSAALYFAFRVADEDVVIVDGPPDDESLVARGDRVELFFARDAELNEYYSIEIDPRGRVLDYSARFYRRFDDAWDCPGLTVAARQRAGGYDVEGRLPFRALDDMGLSVGSAPHLLAGVFRGEFSHRGQDIAESWISWVRPQVPEPDFHVPSAFGCFRLGVAGDSGPAAPMGR